MSGAIPLSQHTLNSTIHTLTGLRMAFQVPNPVGDVAAIFSDMGNLYADIGTVFRFLGPHTATG